MSRRRDDGFMAPRGDLWQDTSLCFHVLIPPKCFADTGQIGASSYDENVDAALSPSVSVCSPWRIDLTPAASIGRFHAL